MIYYILQMFNKWIKLVLQKKHLKVLFKWNLKVNVNNYFYFIDNISSYLQPTLNVNLLKKRRLALVIWMLCY